jgi:four helix bundle protein
LSSSRFEDLNVWQKARILTRLVYEITRDGEFARDYGLSNQMQRASVSIMSNIAEGHERNNPKEFRRYLVIARASCAELRCQFYIAYDVGYIDQNSFESYLNQCLEVSRMLRGLQNSLDSRF